MARKPWYLSRVFWILIVLFTAVLFVFHGPILHALQAWADRYFSQKGIDATLGWMSDPKAGILESLGRLVVGLVAGLFFIVLAVVVWFFLYAWKFYLVLPVVGGAISWCLWFVVGPLVPKRRGKKTEPSTSTETRARTLEKGSPFQSTDAREETPGSRRTRIEAWFLSEDAVGEIRESCSPRAFEAKPERAVARKRGWGFRRA